jgi:hypothetical protein
MSPALRRLLSTVLSLSMALASSAALALPSGWTAEMTETDVKYYDENGKRRYHAWVDADGFHEETRASGGGKGGVFTDGTLPTGLDLQVVAAVPVAQVVVYELSTGTPVFEHGPIRPGERLLVHMGGFSDTVQMLVAQDAGGRALDVIFFKRPGVCSSGSWLAR